MNFLKRYPELFLIFIRNLKPLQTLFEIGDTLWHLSTTSSSATEIPSKIYGILYYRKSHQFLTISIPIYNPLCYVISSLFASHAQYQKKKKSKCSQLFPFIIQAEWQNLTLLQLGMVFEKSEGMITDFPHFWPEKLYHKASGIESHRDEGTNKIITLFLRTHSIFMSILTPCNKGHILWLWWLGCFGDKINQHAWKGISESNRKICT